MKMYLETLCRMGPWSFWSWFDVNRSNSDEGMRKNDFYFYVSNDLVFWPLELKFDP